MEPVTAKPKNPMFVFMGIGSLVYALFYTLFLYKNASGITYPFFVGGTCLFFFLYLKKSGITAKTFSLFPAAALILLGISTCLTDNRFLLCINKLMIFCLFFYLALHNLYQDNRWDLVKYTGSALNIICTSLTFLFRPFTDLADYVRTRGNSPKGGNGKIKYVVLGCSIALPLVLVILALLCSADAVFSSIFEHSLLHIYELLFDGNIWGLGCTFLFAFFAAYCIMSRLSLHDIKEEMRDKRTAEPLVAITFTGILSLVYLIFCFIQIVYLFGGFGTLPEGYTYASYAREGFFQLVFVCFINLVLVLVCMKHFRKNNVLKGILTFISLCTYIMIASSAYRMLLYIDVYYLTLLRVLVLWGLAVISLLVLGALIMIYAEGFPLIKYCLITVTSLYILLSFWQPDRFIAAYNLTHSIPAREVTAEEEIYDTFYDYHYLENLSMDAAPIIIANADTYGYQDKSWFHYYTADIAALSGVTLNELEANSFPDFKKPSLRKWNYSRWTAINSCMEYYSQDDLQTAATPFDSPLLPE